MSKQIDGNVNNKPAKIDNKMDAIVQSSVHSTGEFDDNKKVAPKMVEKNKKSKKGKKKTPSTVGAEKAGNAEALKKQRFRRIKERMCKIFFALVVVASIFLSMAFSIIFINQIQKKMVEFNRETNVIEGELTIICNFIK